MAGKEGGEKMKKYLIIILIILILVAGAAGFFGGMKYQQSQRAASPRQFGMMGNGSNNRANGFRPVAGNIISLDSKSITVQQNDGSSKIVFLSGNTVINTVATASADILKAGVRVSVFGVTNSDGSVTAQNIQINPILRQNSGQ